MRQVIEVVIPVHDEARPLAANVRRLHAHLRENLPFDFRLTIADRASTDGTGEVAERLAAELPGVRTVRLDHQGRGRALRHVWERSDADFVAYTDAALSTGLQAFLPLVAPLISGHSDLAAGTRLANGADAVRGGELLSRCYNTLLRLFLRAVFTDAQCPFKAVRTEVAQALLPEIEDEEWFFDTELLLAAQHSGLRIHEVPVDWTEAPGGRAEAGRTVRHGLKGMARVLLTRFRRGLRPRRTPLRRAP